MTDVTCCIPVYGCNEFLRSAVDSILAQTHCDLVCVVVNDGGPEDLLDPLDGLDDPRLVRFRLPRNMGRYFADQVVLTACRTPYYLMQDADDWSEPDRLEKLLALLDETDAVAAVSSMANVYADGRHSVHHFPEASLPPQPNLAHRAGHNGVFRTAALRDVGGYWHGHRVGTDTAIMAFLAMLGRIVSTDELLYHRRIHRQSLTHQPMTAYKSPYRNNVFHAIARAYFEIWPVYQQYQAETVDRETLAAAIRGQATKRLPRSGVQMLETEAERLGGVL